MPPKNRHVEVLRALWRELPDGMRSRAQPLVRRARGLASAGAIGGHGGGGPVRPLLSVVVPVYNVEEYLEQCLASLARQSVARMEIIIVDDGSTDASFAIVQKFAAKDRRFVIIRQSNAGLGAARNAGIARATGKYLGFADSDDVIPDGSYVAMLDALKTSGSDFAVGSIRRLAGGRKRHSAWAAKLHAVRRIGTNIDEFPDALQDVFAWNKIFSRAFWDEHIGWFPEGLLYEDQEMSSKAFLRAAAFDMLPEVVYEWRIRSDRSSITQQKSNITDLRDRLTVIGHMKALMDAEASSTVRDTWLAKVLGGDLGYYYRQVPRVGADYWELLQRNTAALVSQSGSTVWQRMKVQDRLTAYLVAEGHRADVETVLVHQVQYGNGAPLEMHGDGTLLAQPRFLAELEHEIPRKLLEVNPLELRLQTHLTAVRQHSDGSLELEGSAQLPGLDLRTIESAVAVRLRESNGPRTIDLPAWQVDDVDKRATAPGEHGPAFRTFVGAEALEGLRAGDGDAAVAGCEWTIEIVRTFAGIEFTAPFRNRDRSGTAAAMPLLPVNGDSRWDARFDDERGLVFRPIQVPYTVTDFRIEGRSLSIDVSASSMEGVAALVLEGPGGRQAIGRPEMSTFSRTLFRVELPVLEVPDSVSPSKPMTWQFRVRSASGTLYPVSWPGTSEQLRGCRSDVQTLQAFAIGPGHFELREFRLAIAAAAVSVNSGEITVSGKVGTNDGRLPSDVIGSFQLVAPGAEIPASAVDFAGDGGFTARFPVHQEAWGRRVAAPLPGNYILHYSLRAEGTNDSEQANDETPSRWAVPVSSEFELSLPTLVQLPSCTVRIGRSAVAASLTLRFSPPAESSVASQPRQSLADATFFESFSGRAAADSPLAIHRELVRRGDKRPKYWSVTDLSVAVPDGGTPVVRFSRQWYELLETAAYLVNNGFFPSNFRKSPGQTYVQTWHGTPLKKIGHDGPTRHLNLSRLAALNHEPAQWDSLLAQNDYAAQVLPTALRYTGEVMVIGYPRNDSLITQAPAHRAVVRELLGISNNQTAVLYLPTWRDDVTDFNKPHGHVDMLEPAILRAGLGEDWVVLRRSHPDMTGHREALARPDLDVSGYPDINDLYLAADILVTDYSSVMFDFCKTGKPMYFLAPDLESFRSGPRGFYLDLETVAPCPVVASTPELVAVLKDDQAASRDYRERLDAFAGRFAGIDDGGAAARVVDAVW
ncbi:bifunctional glycosyltransferase/CDP-glycerol:glycerophosphate glycerophosphotransferase [Arthrobacter pigmenti]